MRQNPNLEMQTLQGVYFDLLASMHHCERLQQPALIGAIRHLASAEYRMLVERHAKETSEQIHRLAAILARHHARARGQTECDLAGMVRQAELLSSRNQQSPMHDQTMLAALRKLEAEEVSQYATLHNYARLLSFHADLAPLEQSFAEEKQIAEVLTGIVDQHRTRDTSGRSERECVM